MFRCAKVFRCANETLWPILLFGHGRGWRLHCGIEVFCAKVFRCANETLWHIGTLWHFVDTSEHFGTEHFAMS